ncbi:MAG: ABC transporter permease, partial [Pirellulales bacterium]|nr:ABC transporter permease [Pirellulales bacterium]
WLLLITVLQVGAISVFCSALFSSTAVAFVATYLVGIALYVGPAFVGGVAGFPWSEDFAFGLFGFYWFVEGARGLPASKLFTSTVPIILSAVVFLLLARIALVRRAFVDPKNFFLEVFRWLDRVFLRWNDRIGGITLVRDTSRLPVDRPVAWRETQKRSLGTFRYLFRVFVIIEVPVAMLCLMVLMFESRNGGEPLRAVALFLWILSTLIVVLSASNSIASERSRETLDVLLTTPLSGREIVLQKAAGIRRLILVLSVPFLTVFLIVGGLIDARRSWSSEPPLWMWYPVVSTLTLAVTLPLAGWIAMWASLKAKTQMRAVAISVSIIAGWCLWVFLLIPVIAIFEFHGLLDDEHLAYMSPAFMTMLTQGMLYTNSYVEIALTALPFYAVVLLVVRALCLARADRYLGRPYSMPMHDNEQDNTRKPQLETTG